MRHTIAHMNPTVAIPMAAPNAAGWIGSITMTGIPSLGIPTITLQSLLWWKHYQHNNSQGHIEYVSLKTVKFSSW